MQMAHPAKLARCAMSFPEKNDFLLSGNNRNDGFFGLHGLLLLAGNESSGRKGENSDGLHY